MLSQFEMAVRQLSMVLPYVFMHKYSLPALLPVLSGLLATFPKLACQGLSAGCLAACALLHAVVSEADDRCALCFGASNFVIIFGRVCAARDSLQVQLKVAAVCYSAQGGMQATSQNWALCLIGHVKGSLGVVHIDGESGLLG
jgi:hypothetical protein